MNGVAVKLVHWTFLFLQFLAKYLFAKLNICLFHDADLFLEK